MKPIVRILLRSPRCALGLMVVALAGGCVTEPPVPATITISRESVTLTQPGYTLQLLATVKDQYGQTLEGAEVSWSSQATTVLLQRSSRAGQVWGW